LCAALGLPELASDERFATSAERVAHATQLACLLDAPLSGRSSANRIEALEAVGVPCGLPGLNSQALRALRQQGVV